NVISVDEAELEDDGDNNKLATTNIIQKLISEIDDDSEAYRSLNEALSSASNVKTLSAETSNSSKIEVLNSASNIEALNFISNVDEALNVTSNIDKALNPTLNLNKNFITKIDPKILEYIDNNIEDSNKQFLRQLILLFLNYNNISEEPKLLINQIKELIKNYNENSDKVFKRLLKYQGQPVFAYLIGFFYEHGIGVKINQRKAQRMYEQAKEYENNIQTSQLYNKITIEES
ncbi:260_t:CDS:2, partial [Racocetra fulgida]